MEIKIDLEELRKKSLFVATPMFGGQCHGSYTRSMADLAVTCAKYGIKMRSYFLFNESLITRARNYCVDEFMRSDFSHLLFIDSDIGFDPKDVITLLALQDEDNEHDVIAGPYPKKCLINKSKIITEDGNMSIASIVNKKYDGKVLSLSQEGKKEWKSIIGHNVTPNNGRKWVSLKLSNKRPRSNVIMTSDHEVSCISDIFNPKIEYKSAYSLIGKWVVRKSSDNSKNNKNNIRSLFNKNQLSVMIGTALGDGCVTDGSLIVCHGIKQSEYNKHKASVLNANIIENDSDTSFSICNAQTKHLKDLIYNEGQKTIKNVIDKIDVISLAYMYMDDGNRYYYPYKITEKTNKFTWWYNNDLSKRAVQCPGKEWNRGRKSNAWEATSSIATMSFTYDDNVLLSEHLKAEFDIVCTIKKQNDHHYLSFDKENTRKLHELISPYVVESMEYKLNPEFRGGVKNNIDKTPLEYAAVKVIDVMDYEDDTNSKLYDITVEDNNNFFANDMLVHNCITWEKIKAAVDKGVADENASKLEDFVGDFVFNPVTGTKSIRLDEPAEVSEAGTGFMMIRRSTFEKFPAPQYLPDHIRTEHFDGKREIGMYFQAEIDPKSKRYLSEDYWFCQKCREVDMKVWLCPWMHLKHTGSYIYGGQLAALASIGASATADPKEIEKGKK